MSVDTVEVIGPEGTTRTALFPIRAEHEVVDQQLRMRAEEVGERDKAVLAGEAVSLVYSNFRQGAAAGGKCIARAHMGLFGVQKVQTGVQPSVAVGDHYRVLR